MSDAAAYKSYFWTRGFSLCADLGVKVTLVELDPAGFVKAVAKHKRELIAAFPQFFGSLLRVMRMQGFETHRFTYYRSHSAK
jgi:dihydropteroate synthase